MSPDMGMFPGEEPGSLLRYSPVYGIIKGEDWHTGRIQGFEHLSGLHHQADWNHRSRS